MTSPKEEQLREPLHINSMSYPRDEREVVGVLSSREALCEILTQGPLVITDMHRPRFISHNIGMTGEESTQFLHHPQGDIVAFYYPIEAKRERQRNTAFGLEDDVAMWTGEALMSDSQLAKRLVRGFYPDLSGNDLRHYYESCARNPKENFEPDSQAAHDLMLGLRGQISHIGYTPGTLALFPKNTMIACDATGKGGMGIDGAEAANLESATISFSAKAK